MLEAEPGLQADPGMADSKKKMDFAARGGQAVGKCHTEGLKAQGVDLSDIGLGNVETDDLGYVLEC